jgi:hypothetical protein
MDKFSEPQIRALQATARGEAILTHTGSAYTITGPAGSKALWSLLRAGLAEGPKLPRRAKTPLILTVSGEAALSAIDRRSQAPSSTRATLVTLPSDASRYGRIENMRTSAGCFTAGTETFAFRISGKGECHGFGQKVEATTGAARPTAVTTSTTPSRA